MSKDELRSGQTHVENVVLGSPVLTSSEKLFYTAICRFRVNDKGSPQYGRCFPGMRAIYELAGISPRTAKRARERLVALGVIQYKASRGRGHRSCYLFPLVVGSTRDKESICQK